MLIVIMNNLTLHYYFTASISYDDMKFCPLWLNKFHQKTFLIYHLCYHITSEHIHPHYLEPLIAGDSRLWGPVAALVVTVFVCMSASLEMFKTWMTLKHFMLNFKRTFKQNVKRFIHNMCKVAIFNLKH